MKILLVTPRGFCAGVDMALRALDAVLELHPPPVYCYHQIVHNTHVVVSYENRGVVFVDDVETVPPGAVTVFSAHGVAPAVRERAWERGLVVVDATCPLVSKVHAEARRFASRQLPVILVGHQGHDETVGVMGEAPGAIHLVEDAEDVEALELPTGSPAAFVTQTTLSVDDTRDIIEALRDRFPGIQGPPTEDICYATQNRQEAVRRVAPECDLAVVVGSRNSSNSRRLVEVAESRGCPARLVDGPGELDPAWFRADGTVLVSSGASVPEALVEGVVDWIGRRFPLDIEERAIVEEGEVVFNLPPELRRRLREAGAGGTQA